MDMPVNLVIYESALVSRPLVKIQAENMPGNAMHNFAEDGEPRTLPARSNSTAWGGHYIHLPCRGLGISWQVCTANASNSQRYISMESHFKIKEDTSGFENQPIPISR